MLLSLSICHLLSCTSTNISIATLRSKNGGKWLMKHCVKRSNWATRLYHDDTPITLFHELTRLHTDTGMIVKWISQQVKLQHGFLNSCTLATSYPIKIAVINVCWIHPFCANDSEISQKIWHSYSRALNNMSLPSSENGSHFVHAQMCSWCFYE